MSTLSVKQIGSFAFFDIWMWCIVYSGAWYIGVPAHRDYSAASFILLMEVSRLGVKSFFSNSADICLHPIKEALNLFLSRCSLLLIVLIELN
jgi:hypothetical protein